MKIALVSRRYPPLIGGAEKVLSYLAAALAAEGADVTVLTARALDLPPSETPLTANGSLTIVRLPTAKLRFIGTLRYMRNLRNWFGRNRVDLAYVSMLKHDAFVVVGAGRRWGFPVVLRPEGAGATGDVAWQGWGRFGGRIARRCREADALVAIAPAITEELTKAGHDPRRISALPNGVPVPETPWQPRPDWQSAPRAIFVGRIAPEKGIDVLLSAWVAVRRARPEARLALAGDGPERPALTALAERLGVAAAVEWLGPLTDPAPALRGSDLFVLPSREEGMSIALLEAMALGLPVVASAIAGNRALITDCRHGRLAPPDDPAALARTILDQWAHPDQARALGRAARDRVAAHFSITAVARGHLELFRRLTTRAPDRGVPPRGG